MDCTFPSTTASNNEISVEDKFFGELGAAKSVTDHLRAFSSWPTEGLIDLQARLKYCLDQSAREAIRQLIAERLSAQGGR